VSLKPSRQHKKVLADLLGLCFNCFSDDDHAAKVCLNPSCCFYCREPGHQAQECTRSWFVAAGRWARGRQPSPPHLGTHHSHHLLRRGHALRHRLLLQGHTRRNLLYQRQPSLWYRIFIDIIEVEDCHALSESSAGSNSNSSVDSMSGLRIIGFSHPWPKRIRLAAPVTNSTPDQTVSQEGAVDATRFKAGNVHVPWSPHLAGAAAPSPGTSSPDNQECSLPNL
jgi:hypothetical protein